MKPQDARAAAEIAKLIGYLQRHRDRVNYRFARKRGYPIGSGGIESATSVSIMCGLSAQQPSGMWKMPIRCWPLRCAKYNGTFDRVFEAYRQKAKQSSARISHKK
jgi:hypothetical protein